MIYGKRIRLRALNKDDLPLFVTWLNDPEVTSGLMHYLPFSIEDEIAWFDGMRKKPLEERPLMIEVNIDQDWLPIGDLGIFDIDWRIRSAELGIVIGNKEYWNKGYGTEAIGVILEHGFQTLNLNRICLKVYKTNLRAIRAYEKAGFKHEGKLRQGHFQDGQYVDVILMSILKSEWRDSSNRKIQSSFEVRKSNI
jgi:RimJ/RimL family protein N-acetyltransferase